MNVKLYVEGGGEESSPNIACREGFRKLLERAGFRNRMPRIAACGSRNQAFDRFKTALRAPRANEYPVLLVNSEGPVTESAWQHLRNCDHWTRPRGADDEQAQLMVQCMETWCVADRQRLRTYFGACLQENRLPALNQLEGRAKGDVQTALSRATQSCGRDRAYKKGAKSFELLAELDPAELRQRLPHFVRLCDMLERRL